MALAAAVEAAPPWAAAWAMAWAAALALAPPVLPLRAWMTRACTARASAHRRRRGHGMGSKADWSCQNANQRGSCRRSQGTVQAEARRTALLTWAMAEATVLLAVPP